MLEYARRQLDWTIIRSPIDGVVLEKSADENELVHRKASAATRVRAPRCFGGGSRGPAGRNRLNEADLSKVWLTQPCRITPEAYPEHVYNGFVAEIAPEANRQKGILQVKVQVKEPDRYLVPELSARVDFLGVSPRCGLSLRGGSGTGRSRA